MTLKPLLEGWPAQQVKKRGLRGIPMSYPWSFYILSKRLLTEVCKMVFTIIVFSYVFYKVTGVVPFPFNMIA